MTHDVIVLGLGAMGSAAAAHLARRGQRVLGFEQFGPAHDRGSSHGESRAIRQSYFEDPAYVPLLLRAYELWDDLGGDLLTLTGGLYIGRPGSPAVDGARKAADEHDLPYELLDAADIRRRFPAFTPADHEVALYEQRAGWVKPEAAVTAHLERATAAGADLRFDTPVRAWTATDTGVQVTTADGVCHHADRLVVAAGAWTPGLIPGLPLTVTRQVLAWFTPNHDPQLPVYFHDRDDGSQLYGFPKLHGTTKLAFFYGGSETTPDTIDRTVTDAEVDHLRHAAEQIVPGVAGTRARTATCLYTLTPDHHFILDRPRENVLVLSPCSGHGFKFAPVIGEIAADLVIDGATRHPIERFEAARFRGS